MHLLLNKNLSRKIFRDIDEPMICGKYIIFIQNSSSGSKISISNIDTGKTKSISMKGVFCFNAHTDNFNAVFEFSGNKRGIGVLYIDSLYIKEVQDISDDAFLGGIWHNIIVFRQGSDIVFSDIDKAGERKVVPCRHLIGRPVVGGGNCAWLELYKDKCIISLCGIENDYSLTFMPIGYVNRMYVLGEYIAYQSCEGPKCSVYAYNTSTGVLNKCFESANWIDLYSGKGDTLVWTVRKAQEDRYIFDIWIYNISNNMGSMVLTNNENTVIPAVSEDMAVWVEYCRDGDSLCFIPLNLE